MTPPEGAVIPALDRGFLFGDSVYETVRTYGGRPFRLTRHLERLAASARALGIPVERAPVDIAAEVGRVLDGAGNPESAVRIVLTRGVGPITYDPAVAGPPTVVIYVRPYEPIPAAWQREGVDVAIVRVARNPPEALDPAIKSGNLLNNFQAWREARATGAYEPILLNAQGHLAEGASSNLFLVRDGGVATPALDDGILHGITRELVLAIARREGLPVAETSLTPDDLRHAREAFLTSTLKGILPIRRCDGWPVNDGRPGPITLRLRDLYDRQAQDETKAGADPGAIRR